MRKMRFVQEILGVRELDGLVLWFIIATTLVIFIGPIYALITSGLDIVTDAIGTILYKLLRPLLIAKDKSTPKKKISKNITYGIQKEKRDNSFRKKDGKINMPEKNPLLIKYRYANTHYPEFGTDAQINAKKLNMKYFTSKNYPYDYIPMGHRAAIEESRKGERLTGKEECLVFLGYGYDGRPFGEPWGLEKEFLNDYLYAQREGDFLEWTEDIGAYVNFVGSGYTPMKDHHKGINKDTVLSAELKLMEYGENIKRLSGEQLQYFNN